MSGWISRLKGVLGLLAGLVIAGSDLAGIQHPTIAKSIAGFVLAALGADAVAKNDAAARAALRSGVVTKDAVEKP